MLRWIDNFSIYGVGGVSYPIQGMYAEFNGGASDCTYELVANPAGGGKSVVRFAPPAEGLLHPDWDGWDYEIEASTSFTEVATDRDLNKASHFSIGTSHQITVLEESSSPSALLWHDRWRWRMDDTTPVDGVGTWYTSIGGNFINYAPDHGGNRADVAIYARHFADATSGQFYTRSNMTGFGQWLDIPFQIYTPWYDGRYVHYTPKDDSEFPRLRLELDASAETIGASARVWMNILDSSSESGAMMRFADDADTTQIWLQVTGNGTIKAFLGAFNGDEPTLLGESETMIFEEDWYHIEAKGKFTTDGTLVVRVDGYPALDLTGDFAVGNANCQNVSVAGRFTDETDMDVHWKDLVVWDTSGPRNHNFIGPRPILWCPADEDALLTWTPSTGAEGYPMLDESGPNDADYISAAVGVTTPSRFGIENLPEEASSVVGLMMIGRMKKSDAGDGTVTLGFKVEEDTDEQTADPLTTSETYYSHVVEESPVTGDSLTVDEFNESEITTDRTA